MKVSDLIPNWEKTSGHQSLTSQFTVDLPPYEAARIHALAQMYSDKSPENIIHDLIIAALNELETTMPYVPGYNVISKDETGEPIYDDIGPSPLYRALTKKLLSTASA
ncbi:MAG TPA: hypothetical protein ENJ26_00410 [Rhodobacteraceae bacterium]|nr:hypothetical protein [Paracoccaceae bacterium]